MYAVLIILVHHGSRCLVGPLAVVDYCLGMFYLSDTAKYT